MIRPGHLPLLLILLAPAAARAQRAPDMLPGPAQYRQAPLQELVRRRELQQQLFRRFMRQASLRLGLDPQQQQQLVRVVAANEVRRRDLAREARLLRQQLASASRDTATPQAEYDRLLGRMAELRARDLELWRGEQAQLGQVLTPRQQAQFMAMRLEFFERVQRLRERRRELAQQPAPAAP